MPSFLFLWLLLGCSFFNCHGLGVWHCLWVKTCNNILSGCFAGDNISFEISNNVEFLFFIINVLLELGRLNRLLHWLRQQRRQRLFRQQYLLLSKLLLREGLRWLLLLEQRRLLRLEKLWLCLSCWLNELILRLKWLSLLLWREKWRSLLLRREKVLTE